MLFNFFNSKICKSGTNCRECRRGRDFRQFVIENYDNPDVLDFECPKGKTIKDYPGGIEVTSRARVERLVRSFVQEGLAIVHRKSSITDIESQNRLDICNCCQYYESGWCAKCGCCMRIKVRFRSVSCLIGKW